MATYTAKTRNIGHRPRSKRLRELGGSVTINNGGTSESGGGSYAPMLHTHEMEDVDGLNSAMADFSQQLSEKATTADVISQIASLAGSLQAFQLIRNLVTAIDEQSTDAQYPSAKLLYDKLTALAQVYAAIVHTHTAADITGLATMLAGYALAQHTHTISDLTNPAALFTQFALDNGTLNLTVGGQQRSVVLPTSPTPSGDPMHYLYEAIGCTYNTQTGLWTYRDLDDLTNEDVRNAYCFTFSDREATSRSMLYYARGGNNPEANIRFNIAPRYGWDPTSIGVNRFCQDNGNIERVYLSYADGGRKKINGASQFALAHCDKLKSVDSVLTNVGYLYVETSSIAKNSFNYCAELETLKLSGINQTAYNNIIYFHRDPKLSLESIAFMIVNAANTVAMTIMLHADAYARAQADTTEYTYNGNTYTGCLALASARNITVAIS